MNKMFIVIFLLLPTPSHCWVKELCELGAVLGTGICNIFIKKSENQQSEKDIQYIKEEINTILKEAPIMTALNACSVQLEDQASKLQKYIDYNNDKIDSIKEALSQLEKQSSGLIDQNVQLASLVRQNQIILVVGGTSLAITSYLIYRNVIQQKEDLSHQIPDDFETKQKVAEQMKRDRAAYNECKKSPQKNCDELFMQFLKAHTMFKEAFCQE